MWFQKSEDLLRGFSAGKFPKGINPENIDIWVFLHNFFGEDVQLGKIWANFNDLDG